MRRTSRTGSRFQSTLPHGSDVAGDKELAKGLQFQSTLPHGSDLFAIVLLILVSANFNPRSLTGATLALPSRL